MPVCDLAEATFTRSSDVSFELAAKKRLAVLLLKSNGQLKRPWEKACHARLTFPLPTICRS